MKRDPSATWTDMERSLCIAGGEGSDVELCCGEGAGERVK